MKCLFAIPKDVSGRVRTACKEYAHELEAWTPEAAAAADRLADLVENVASGQLRLGDDDWSALRTQLEAGGQSLALSEIFWSAKEASRIADAIDEFGRGATPRAMVVGSWLRAESGGASAVVALTR